MRRTKVGTKERRAKERETLKDTIVSAAKDIALQEGWHAVTVRKIAEKIEYTPPIIYQYFKDKNELFNEIKREGYQKLLAYYKRILIDSKDATEILTNLALAYWDFAWENPELYKLMYGLEGAIVRTDDLSEETKQIRLTIKNTLALVLEESHSSLYNKDFDWGEAVDILRSLLHGVIAFSMSGSLQGDRERARSLAMKGVQDLVTFWMEQ